MRVLNVVVEGEGHLKRVAELIERIRLTILLEIVNGVEQRHSVFVVVEFVAKVVGEIFQFQRHAVSAAVPVADVGTYPHLTLQVALQWSNLHLIEYRIHPFLSGNLHLIVEEAHTEAGEEAH